MYRSEARCSPRGCASLHAFQPVSTSACQLLIRTVSDPPTAPWEKAYVLRTTALQQTKSWPARVGGGFKPPPTRFQNSKMMRDLRREEPRLRSSSHRTSPPPSTRRPVPEVKNATALLWAVATAGRC